LPEDFRLIAVLSPEDSKKALETGCKTMIVGWAADGGGVVRPAGRFLCDLICLDVNTRSLSDVAELLVGECRAVGAKGIFINPKGTVPEAAELEAFMRVFKIRGLKIYMPKTICTPGAIAVSELSASEHELSAASDSAVFLRALCKKTVVPKIGTAVSKNIHFPELTSLIERFSPRIYNSSELGAKYFTCKDGSDTIFCVFDDRESFRRKIELMRSNGVSECFVLWNEFNSLGNI